MIESDSRRALPNATGSLVTVSARTLAALTVASASNERRRTIYPVQRSETDPVQRLINVLQADSYIRPHMHPEVGASETIIVLKGSILFLQFDDIGTILSHTTISSTDTIPLVDIEQRVWHTFIPLEDNTIVFECKKGPYDPEKDKVFAFWAPSEDNTLEQLQWIQSQKNKFM
jgi:cupin fold WbuC family metalloprotein